MPSTWDPTQYLHYAAERERSFWDLVARIPSTSPREVVDLGCGPGTATAGLLDRWPDATIVGVDNSPAMIERATTLASPPRLTFTLADVATWRAGPVGVDVVLSNATLQWVPGHIDLFPRWLASLHPGGVLAFQVPGNFDAPSHVLLRDVAASRRWRDQFRDVSRAHGGPTPEEYHRRLRALGAAVDVWETTYYQSLSGPDPILDWVRGTALRPYLAALGPGEAAEFAAAYGEELRRAYPPEPSGETLFPFRRIFVVATPG